jgi:hypothetical protein
VPESMERSSCCKRPPFVSTTQPEIPGPRPILLCEKHWAKKVGNAIRNGIPVNLAPA